MHQPRHLTRDEIERLVQRIPMVKAATEEAAIMATEQIRAKLRIQLSEQKLCPEMIDKLGDHIVNAFYRSRIEPGDPVGIAASEGIGGPATQMTLSGFHNAGSSKNVGSGLDIIRELLNISQKRRVESTVIHFRRKDLTFEDVLEHRREIVGITVKDLLKTTPTLHTIITESEPLTLMPYRERGWWYEPFIALMDLAPPDESGLADWESYHFLRIELNKARMFSHRLTPADVIRTLESGKDNMLKCVVTPSIASSCIIDIYPIQSSIIANLSDLMKTRGGINPGIGTYNASLILLQLFVAPNLGEFLIKGIRGITQIFPQSYPTISMVRAYEPEFRDADLDLLTAEQEAMEEQRAERETQPGDPRDPRERVNTWRAWIDPIKFKINGIPLIKLDRLFQLAGFTVKHRPHELVEDDYFSTEPPPQRPFSHEPPYFTIVVPPEHSGRRPNDIIKELLEADELETSNDVKARKRAVTVISTIIGYHSNPDNTWTLELDDAKLKTYKVTLEELAQLLQDRCSMPAEVSLAATGAAEVRVVLPFGWNHPQTVIHEHIPATDRFATPVISELGRLGMYAFAESNGANLRATLAHPLVDNRRSISNNANDIYSVISLQAAYAFISKDFYDTIVNNSAYCSPRHIATLVSFMTNVSLMSVTSRGVSRQNRGAFSDASFEHAIEAFIKAATSGQWESADATSTSIFFGNRGKFGTGAFNVGIDREALQALQGTKARVPPPAIASDFDLGIPVGLDGIQLQLEGADREMPDGDGVAVGSGIQFTGADITSIMGVAPLPTTGVTVKSVARKLAPGPLGRMIQPPLIAQLLG
jgi:hypothetical protein